MVKLASYRMVICVAAVIGALMFQDLAFAQSGKYEEVKFFSGYQDIPVMSGLVEQEDRSFTFDKPDGDITEIVALLDGLSEEEVIGFYKTSLPQFGWSRVGDYSYFRKSEYMELSFDKKDEKRFVRIMIRPSL